MNAPLQVVVAKGGDPDATETTVWLGRDAKRPGDFEASVKIREDFASRAWTVRIVRYTWPQGGGDTFGGGKGWTREDAANFAAGAVRGLMSADEQSRKLSSFGLVSL